MSRIDEYGGRMSYKITNVRFRVLTEAVSSFGMEYKLVLVACDILVNVKTRVESF